MTATLEVSGALALEVATGIGYGIARRALWHEDRCTWFDSVPVMPGTGAPKSATAGFDVYGGTAGIGLFLAQLAARTGDAPLRRTARAAFRQTFRAIGASATGALGFYAGKAGAAAAAILAGIELGDDEPVERGRALLRELPLAPDDPDGSDLVVGTAGSLLALGVAAAALGDAALLERAKEAARILISLGHRNPDGSLSWSTMSDKLADLTGFAHGSAGNAYALLALHALAPDEALRDAVAGALAYERSTFVAEYGNWPDYRWFGTGPREPNYPVSWCHGAVGIVRARFLAESLGFDVAGDVDVALDTTVQHTLRQLADPAGDATLCHGLFGSLDALIDGVRSGRAQHAPLVARCANLSTDRHHYGEDPWPSGLMTHEPIDGLMMGDAGVGHVYLRLADPGLRSVLAPAVSARGRAPVPA